MVFSMQCHKLNVIYRRQLEMKEEEVRMLRDKINVNDTVVQEIRDTNLQLRNENKRLISSESKSTNNVSQLLDDVRILLSKVSSLKIFIFDNLYLLLIRILGWAIEKWENQTYLWNGGVEGFHYVRQTIIDSKFEL